MIGFRSTMLIIVVMGIGLQSALAQLQKVETFEESSWVPPPPEPQPGSAVTKPNVRYEDEDTVIRSHELGISMELAAGNRVAVRSVIVGSPAHQGGLRPRDTFLSVSGVPASDIQTVIGLFRSLAASRSVAVQVERKGVVEMLVIDMTKKSNAPFTADRTTDYHPQSIPGRQGIQYVPSNRGNLRGYVDRSATSYGSNYYTEQPNYFFYGPGYRWVGPGYGYGRGNGYPRRFRDRRGYGRN